MKSPEFDPDLRVQEEKAMATRPVEKDVTDNTAPLPVLSDLTAMRT